MHATMGKSEFDLFKAFVDCSKRYLEFGTGGSTLYAAMTDKDWIVSVESSHGWIAQVAEACSSAATQPQFHHVDIGPTGDWGYPTDASYQQNWHTYSRSIWQHAPHSHEADFCFIDGRFRVACFLQALINTESSLIAFHDYADRPHYHVVQAHAVEIARAQRLSVFMRNRSWHRDAIATLIGEYAIDPR